MEIVVIFHLDLNGIQVESNSCLKKLKLDFK